jgi:hypothetical protein
VELTVIDGQTIDLSAMNGHVKLTAQVGQ